MKKLLMIIMLVSGFQLHAQESVSTPMKIVKATSSIQLPLLRVYTRAMKKLVELGPLTFNPSEIDPDDPKHEKKIAEIILRNNLKNAAYSAIEVKTAAYVLGDMLANDFESEDNRETDVPYFTDPKQVFNKLQELVGKFSINDKLLKIINVKKSELASIENGIKELKKAIKNN